MSRTTLSLWLCCLLVTVALSVNTLDKELTKKILEGYETSTRPTDTFQDAVNVTLDIGLREMSELRQNTQTLIVKAWIRFSWYDASLKWNVSDYQGVTRTELSSKNVWLPDIVLYNSAVGSNFRLSNDDSLIVVMHDGRVYWRFPTTLTSFCPLDVTYFPFDKQVCHMKFGSWVFSLAQLDIHPVGETGDTTVYKENNEWILEKFPVERNVVGYNHTDEEFPDLTFSLYLKRRSLYVSFNLVLPSCLIAAIGMLAYILPSNEGEKIGLCVTMLVALSFIMLLMADKMPPTSRSIPLLGEFFAVIVTMLSVTTLLSAFVIHVHFRGGRGKPLPKWAEVLILKGLARILCFDVECSGIEQKNSEVSPSQENGKCAQLNGIRKESETQVEDITNWNQSWNEKKSGDSVVCGNSPLCVIGDRLKSIEGAMLARHRAEDEQSALEDDWRKVGMVLDRLFLIMYLIICVVAALALLLKRP